MTARRRTLARRRVVVNLKTGTVLSGVVWDTRGPILILRGARLLSHLGGPIVDRELDGETIVEVADVDFVQTVGVE